MSQTYRVRVKESLADTVKIGREWRKRVDMLSLLPPEEMGTLLAEELLKDGWEESEGKLRNSQDQFELEFDPISHQMKIVYEEEQDVQLEIDEDMQVYDHGDNEARANKVAQDNARAKLKRNMELKKEEIEVARNAELDKNQAKIIDDLNSDMNEKVEKVHKEALKKKASRLGEIESISEEEESGEITIRIKV